MLAKEFEKAGLPAVLVTAIPAVAQSVGAHRIVCGRGVGYPFGDPQAAPDAEREHKSRLIEEVLKALHTDVATPSVFAASEE